MLKKYKKTLLITSLVTLLPIIAGLLLWNRLPVSIPSHWNAAGEVDGYSSKAMAVFGFPALLLALHWVCTLVTTMDPKHKDIDRKPMNLVLWICPAMSLLIGTLVYATALGMHLSVEIIMPLAMGVLFIIIGNFMPKCKQNYTIGIKVPWALHDEANWTATHRFAGWLWVGGGILIMATSLLGSFWLFIGITLAMAFAPMIYSYLYYRKHQEVSHETDE